MFDLTHLLVSAALAQDTPVDPATAAPSSALTDLMSPQALMMVAIFAVFYFLVIRPNQKKLADQEKVIKALQRGDRIITSSGIHGKITRLEGDDLLIVEIADGVNVKMHRSYVQGLEAKTQPATTAGTEGEKKV